MQTLENHGEMQNDKCNACQWYPKQKNKNYCESCEPLMKRFIKQIKDKYGKNNQREHYQTHV
jgi:hypothetical protein